MEIVKQQSFEYGDQIKMQGIIRNKSKEMIDFAIVSGDAYDEEGKLIGSGTDEIKNIKSGEEVSFEILINPTVGLENIQWHCTAKVE